MEYTLKAQPIYTLKEVLNTSTQQPVDLDFTLPDYCADMEKILKCSVNVKVFSKILSAGQLRIDGTSLVRIIYTDSSRKTLRCCEQNVPFSISLNVSGEVRDYIVYCDASPEYINCRALTPRRVVVHGAIELNTRILTKDTLRLYSKGEEGDLETRETTTSVCALSTIYQDRFTFADSFSMNTKKSVETIVRSELFPKITDYSIHSGQLNVKGELILRMLYICDAATSELDRFVTSIPFTQTLRIPDENRDISKIELSVSSYDVTLKSEMMSEEPLLFVEANLTASVLGFERQEKSYITDAYSTAFETETDSERLSLLTGVEPVGITATTKSTLLMGESPIQKIIDIFADSVKTSCEISEDTLNFRLRADVTIIAVNTDDELVCIERQVEFLKEHRTEDVFSAVDNLKSTVSSLSFRIGDSNDLELRMEAEISGLLVKTENILCAKSVRKTKEIDFSSQSPLVIYYADEGECIWDIAKAFRTSVNSLKEENNLPEDALEVSSVLMLVRK